MTEEFRARITPDSLVSDVVIWAAAIAGALLVANTMIEWCAQ